MPVFCKIKDPSRYDPCEWDMLADDRGRAYWLDHFETQIESDIEYARRQYAGCDRLEERLEHLRRDVLGGIRDRRRHPDDFSPLTSLSLDAFRQDILDRHGVSDPYKDIRAQETQAMLHRLPKLLREIDATAVESRLGLLMRGVFAGNIFDLGSSSIVERYNRGDLDFDQFRGRFKSRPWLVDDLDRLAEQFVDGSSIYRKAIFFIDNAGSDAVLGCMPFVRQLALWGSKVVIAANSSPALNDILANECRELCQRVSAMDAEFNELHKDGFIEVVESGSGLPLIDLSRIDAACNEAAADCDLVVLEGMGRAVESNFSSRFTCDCLKLAVIKNEEVANRLGGILYDAVCRFEPA
jgi:type II pantothenate kinase